MDATTISRAVLQLKTDVLNSIHHQALLKYLQKPALRDRQLFFMLLPLLNENVSDKQLQIATTTVGIIHASLDEHAKIKEQNAVEKTQQLTVLSGDYYSGRYYYLLAQVGNVQLIREMSRAIATRCEAEVQVYESQVLTIEKVLQAWKQIETALIERFFAVYKFERYTSIVELALTAERIDCELQQLHANKPSSFIQQLLTTMDRTQIEQALQQERQTMQVALQQHVQSFPISEALIAEIM